MLFRSHTNSAGRYYLYSTNGTDFSWSTSPWAFSDIQVAIANVGASASTSFAVKETHGTMDYNSHAVLHNQIGTYRSSGGGLTAGTYTTNTATDAANTPAFDASILVDEDVSTAIPATVDGSYTTMYVGASGVSVYDSSATLPFTSAGSYLQVNNITTGTMSAGVSNRYYNVYQILVPATTDSDSQKFRVVMLQPQTTFTTLAAAQAEDIRSLSLGSLPNSPEYVIYGRITYITSNGDNNTGKCRIVTNGVSYVVGNRASQVSVTGLAANDHSSLQNLAWLTSGHYGTPTMF